jgi:hypothetical protein
MSRTKKGQAVYGLTANAAVILEMRQDFGGSQEKVWTCPKMVYGG